MSFEGFERVDPFEGTPGPNGHAASEQEETELAHEPIATIDWGKLDGLDPPPREFVVENWLPTGCATSLYAPGGSGKSLLAQQLASCVAAGRPFLALQTMRAPVLGLFCEDDDNELWRRQQRINRWLSLRMSDLGRFAAQGRLGMANLLATFPKGKPPEFLPLFDEIEAAARGIAAKLVILDNAAQLFGGEENSRAEVTTFINGLNGLARRLGAAVLMLGHPPKSGAEYSGSTGWHAAVRCMWTLGRIATDKDDEEEPQDRLVLTRHKANYAPSGEEIRLRWDEGILRRDDGEVPLSGVEASFRRHNAKMAFLAALDALTEQRRNVSHSERASNFAPKVFKAAGLAGDFTRKELARAMNELFAEKAIVASAELWRGADRKPVLGIARRSADRPVAEGQDPALDERAEGAGREGNAPSAGGIDLG